jgi:pentatricopeptide repeat protein
MIGGYVHCGEGFPALLLLAEKMQHDGIKPDPWLLCDALKACEITGLSKHCRVLHDVIVRASADSDALIGNTLVEVYSARCSLIEGCNAFHRLVRKDTGSWNALIGGYSVNGFPLRVFELFDEMQRQGFAADGATYLHLLRARGESWRRDKARELHSRITSSGMESDGLIGSSLIDMYAKRNFLEEARHVFDGLACKDVVSWGVLLSAYAEQGHCSAVCELYGEMLGEGIKPDRAIWLCLLRACGSSASLLERGREAHDEAIRCELESDLSIANTAIDMYAKCGRLDEARSVFEALASRDEVSWAALIGGYGRHGRSDEVGQFIAAMKEHGLRPRKSIFTSLLAACSHTGDLEECLIYFDTMLQAGIEPAMEHYSCMADLLCRKGHLNEAQDVLRCMPMPPDAVVRVSMLTGCRTYYGDGGGCIGQISHVNDGDNGDDDGDGDGDGDGGDPGVCSDVGYTSCRSVGSVM